MEDLRVDPIHNKCLRFLLREMSRLGPFEVGQIKAHLHHGLSGAAILGILKKPDGRTPWNHQTVYNAIDKLKEDPSWRGDREDPSCRAFAWPGQMGSGPGLVAIYTKSRRGRPSDGAVSGLVSWETLAAWAMADDSKKQAGNKRLVESEQAHHPCATPCLQGRLYVVFKPVVVCRCRRGDWAGHAACGGARHGRKRRGGRGL